MKLKKSAALGTSEDVEQTSDFINKQLSTCGSVNGHCILRERKTGYFNFSSPHEKVEALKTFRKGDQSLPFSEIRNFEFGRYNYHRYHRPFRYLMIAAYRPSIHSSSRILKYLEQFGPSNGREVAHCPYDEDRRFLYLSYRQRSSLTHPSISHRNCFIKGSEVSKEDLRLETDETSNDVYLYPFTEHDESRYKKMILVRAENTRFTGRVKNYFDLKYDKMVETVEKLGSDDHGLRFLVTFRDSYPVYRMFYPKTPFSQVCETFPDTSDRLYITTPNLPKSIWKHNYLRLFNVPPITGGEDVLEFFNDFLDRNNCNPGIVAVSQSTASYYSLNLRNRIRDSPEMLNSKQLTDTYYEIYFANPWHAVDVCQRLILLKEDGGHDFHCAVDFSLYSSVKKYLNV